VSDHTSNSPIIPDLAVYYFTGTGNSRRVAAWIAERAQAAGIGARTETIAGKRAADVSPGGPGTWVGFVTPTHGFTLPWIMLRFLLRLPAGRGTQAFAAATRAGMKIDPVFTPGVSGTLTWLASAILAFKGYRVRGVASFDMPSNWMAVHPGFGEIAARAIIARAEPRVEAFADTLFAGKRAWLSWWNAYELFWALVLWPVSILYVIVGRFFLASINYAGPSCTGCGLCSRMCPTGAITMRGGEKKRPVWSFSCESCMRCLGMCPENAVQVSYLWAFGLWYGLVSLMAIPVFVRVSEVIAKKLAIPATVVTHLLWLVPYLIVLWMSHLLLVRISRMPVFRHIILFSSPTAVYRRYHEPDTRRADLIERERPE